MNSFMTQVVVMDCFRISYVANCWRMSGIDPRAFQGQILQITSIGSACPLQAVVENYWNKIIFNNNNLFYQPKSTETEVEYLLNSNWKTN